MGKRVLVIDDEADIMVYISAALEDSGFEPLDLARDEPVIESIKSLSPDFIIMDIMMPRRSGISIYKELRSDPETSGIPVIIISGMAGAKDLVKDGFTVNSEGIHIPPPDAFFEKPVEIEALLDAVSRLTSGRS